MEILKTLPKWLLIIVLVYMGVLVSYAVYDNRTVEFFPPKIQQKILPSPNKPSDHPLDESRTIPTPCTKWNSRFWHLPRDKDKWKTEMEGDLEKTHLSPEHLFATISVSPPNGANPPADPSHPPPLDTDVHFWWCPDQTGPYWKVRQTASDAWAKLPETVAGAKPIGFFAGSTGVPFLWFLQPVTTP